MGISLFRGLGSCSFQSTWNERVQTRSWAPTTSSVEAGGGAVPWPGLGQRWLPLRSPEREGQSTNRSVILVLQSSRGRGTAGDRAPARDWSPPFRWAMRERNMRQFLEKWENL